MNLLRLSYFLSFTLRVCNIDFLKKYSMHIGIFTKENKGLINFLNDYCEAYTLKNQKLKITLLEKAHFIKVNELKLSYFSFFTLCVLVIMHPNCFVWLI